MKKGAKNKLDGLAKKSLVLIFIFGALIRIILILKSDFPINDGGMFYTMISDLVENNFILPKYTTYNFSGIPFAYPPFSFYIIGFLHTISNIDIIQLLRFVPLTNTILSILIFYLFAKNIVSERLSIIATLFFSVLPRSFEWHIMGGGATRSFGMLFYLLTVYFFSLKNGGILKKILPTTAFFTLTIFSHLEWAAFCGITLIFLGIFNNNQKGIAPKSSLLSYFMVSKLHVVFSLSFLLSAFWWLKVISMHRLKPFYSFLGDGITPMGANSYMSIVLLDITNEPYLTIIGCLSLFGLCYLMINKQFLLPLLYLTPIFFFQRSAENLSLIPLAIMAAISIEAIYNKILSHSASHGQIPLRPLITFILIYSSISFFSLVNSYKVDVFYLDSLASEQRSAMAWVKENIDKGSNFLLITNRPSYAWATDNVSEWFPSLAAQKSIATPQGQEWVGNSFVPSVKAYYAFKECYDKGVECLENTAKEHNIDFEYIYIQKDPNYKHPAPLLEHLLDENESYKVIYREGDCIIYKRQEKLVSHTL